MISQLRQHSAVQLRLAGGADLAVAGRRRCSTLRRVDVATPAGANSFPDRPDATVINETIPLFYVAQNRNALWLVREANGRRGGLFLHRRSAVHSAAANGDGAGCATMFLTGTFELDVPNSGGRLAALFDSAVDGIGLRAPIAAAFIRRMIVQWRRLSAGVARTLASERIHRQAIERELFGGEYTLSSKNDDDLPVVQQRPLGDPIRGWCCSQRTPGEHP